ncbi:hypothetical protein N3K66_005996 [Trichothecium roseum]|uniref:Uncharacterized protein n=1 Tax=Trichothecium roseum TaxID=47278 RepID=A0ACC0V186_9HYPO|nr:hypothetical protein N3K66_005996 [Trichothecium roseum]
MGLGDILEKNFLSHIKQGDILMVSEGKANVDDMFTLKDGILEMYLDKETYERAGLVGRPHGPKGSQARGSRWVVSYDLSRPSMRHGKNGFDRLVHASQTVFKQPLSWLICDSESISLVIDSWPKRPSSTITCNPEALGLGNTAKVPMEIAQEILSQGDRTSLEMSATDIYEWLSLIRLNSPRVEADDKVDPFVARHKWFAFMATGFFRSEIGDSAELSVLRPGNGENDYLMWEIRQE